MEITLSSVYVFFKRHKRFKEGFEQVKMTIRVRGLEQNRLRSMDLEFGDRQLTVWLIASQLDLKREDFYGRFGHVWFDFMAYQPL